MKPHLTQLVITDGRADCLARMIVSFEIAVAQDAIDRRIIVNDCPDPAYGRWIKNNIGYDEQIRPLDRRRAGFSGAIQAGWNAIAGTDFVMHLEDDFVLNRYWDVFAVMDVLLQNPYLAQMALRRQPWNDLEAAAGGVVEQHPDEYEDVFDLERDRAWLEHRLYFTTNPSIYPASLVDHGWPGGSESEGHFSARLFEDPAVRCGLWGQRADTPWVTHIGATRVGTGY